MNAITKEMMSYPQGLLGMKITVMPRTHATVPDEISDNAARTVSENCNALKSTQSGFEEE